MCPKLQLMRNRNILNNGQVETQERKNKTEKQWWELCLIPNSSFSFVSFHFYFFFSIWFSLDSLSLSHSSKDR
jgi:hypothetical protein